MAKVQSERDGACDTTCDASCDASTDRLLDELANLSLAQEATTLESFDVAGVARAIRDQKISNVVLAVGAGIRYEVFFLRIGCSHDNSDHDDAANNNDNPSPDELWLLKD